MLFTNLHFFSIIHGSCMMATNYYSHGYTVSVFASHQYCFFVVKKGILYAVCTNQAYKKKKYNWKMLITTSGFIIHEN